MGKTFAFSCAAVAVGLSIGEGGAERVVSKVTHRLQQEDICIAGLGRPSSGLGLVTTVQSSDSVGVRCCEHTTHVCLNVVKVLLHRPLLLLCALHRDVAQLECGAVVRGGDRIGLAEEIMNGYKIFTFE